MTARQRAKELGHPVVGKLTRIPEKEDDFDRMTGRRFYIDEGGSEYWITWSHGQCEMCIVTEDGNVI